MIVSHAIPQFTITSNGKEYIAIRNRKNPVLYHPSYNTWFCDKHWFKPQDDHEFMTGISLQAESVIKIEGPVSINIPLLFGQLTETLIAVKEQIKCFKHELTINPADTAIQKRLANLEVLAELYNTRLMIAVKDSLKN